MSSLFAWLSRRSKKEQMVDLFSEFVSPELLEAVASQPATLNCLSEGPVEFVFVFAQGASPNETAEIVGAVATIARRNGWMIQDFLCNLVVLVRGTLPIREPLSLDRTALTDKLLQASASKVKVVHGAEVASFGNIGSSARMTYGLLLPSFSEIMTALVSLPLGRGQEFRRG
jgi:hypothetical protein